MKKPLLQMCLLHIILCCWSVAPAQQLYVGTNYHPHDSKPEQWRSDIQLMKDAGFKVVRMGHLAWDSYEPAEGKFEFTWFDQVMDMMNKAGIKVILDIAVRPAPIWLHHKYPTINVTSPDGNQQYPNHRYMEDVGDPEYQKAALLYTDALTKRYAKHPALLAFGIDNEPGDGPISYSETVRKRFITWLETKYITVDSLNQAWAGQRWSRKIGHFEEVGLPQSGSASGSPERTLDFRRFISDEVNQFFLKVIERTNANAPNVLTTTNMWYYSDKKYFDYAKTAYTGKITRGGNGFYPGNSLITNGGLQHALLGIARIQYENTTPFWCTEFTTMTAVPGAIRKAAYASLMYGNQMVCGWTWQTMHAGEEQYIEGMTDWDGITNRKYDEYKQIAAEFKKIEKYGLPYKVQADVAIAYSFPSQIASYAYPQQHDGQLQTAFNVFFKRNIDARVIDISQSDLKYKLLIIPGLAVMDTITAAKIRAYVNRGGTVVMTSESAVVDEHNQVFRTTQPGLLNDVFGIRRASFDETSTMNELSREALKGDQLHVWYFDKSISTASQRFDMIETKGADILGNITSLEKNHPIITINKYGKGQAIYVGLPAREEILNAILDKLMTAIEIKQGPEVPPGVMARYIDARHILYLNLGKEPKQIEQKGKLKSILSEKEYTDKLTLPAFEPEFIEIK